MNGHKLDISSSITQLGLSSSYNVTRKPPINSIEKHASQKLGFLSRAHGYFSPSQQLTIYKSQICPSLEYCFHVWGGAPKSSLHLLDRVQSKGIRLINNREFTIHDLAQDGDLWRSVKEYVRTVSRILVTKTAPGRQRCKFGA